MNTVVILMSTFNGEKYIHEQLNSIYNQDFDGDIKLIIRDDGSTDNTINIIENWSSKIDIEIIKGKNVGVINSFNELILNAPVASYYAFCDQDDVWESNKLKLAIESLNKIRTDQKPLLYFSNAKLVDENLIPYNRNLNTTIPDVKLDKIMVCSPALGCTMVFNESALKLFKSIDIKATPMHDMTMLAICLLMGEVIYDNNTTILYRQHNNNVIGSSKSIKKRIERAYRLWIKGEGKSVAPFSLELLEKLNSEITNEDKIILNQFATYRKSLINRIKIVFNNKIYTTNKRANYSFKLRALIGVA